MSPEDKHKAAYGEGGQADYLVAAKERNSETKQRRPARMWAGRKHFLKNKGNYCRCLRTAAVSQQQVYKQRLDRWWTDQATAPKTMS